ncbi:hypothetical protein NYR54_10475 [Chelativorans sp. SCAU2101]|jgi:hypothetical protein|uniref:Uncharacterized protein n=1 Tax=Chelativorans petroleitrophicus TaxID=2975484 RepID=A0A9X3B6P0_9HYPH|nr:hypothetical protein [Chelativorans petroleitrophicus]MCT8990712.1 hypothetical protein [Chelativorans petroleitrophicus]
MNPAITKDTLFPPRKTNPATRAEATDRAARAIIEEEKKQREAKTARLRQARLEMEARQPKPEPVKSRNRRKPAGTRRQVR